MKIVKDALDDLIDNIRPETRGLLDYITQVTGFSSDEIFLQSIFSFYPYLFVELNTGINTWMIMNKLIYSQFEQLKKHYKLQSDTQMICKLFDIKSENEKFVSRLDLNYLNQLVRHTVGFDERILISRTKTDQIEYFLETCILQYLLTIYPIEIIEDVFSSESDQFIKINIQLTASQAKEFIQQISSNYANRKFEEEVNRKVFNKFNHLYALRVL